MHSPQRFRSAKEIYFWLFLVVVYWKSLQSHTIRYHIFSGPWYRRPSLVLFYSGIFHARWIFWGWWRNAGHKRLLPWTDFPTVTIIYSLCGQYGLRRNLPIYHSHPYGCTQWRLWHTVWHNTPQFISFARWGSHGQDLPFTQSCIN